MWLGTIRDAAHDNSGAAIRALLAAAGPMKTTQAPNASEQVERASGAGGRIYYIESVLA